MRAPGSRRRLCCLSIAAIAWGAVMQVEVGAWTYHYSDQGDYTWEQARNYCRTFFTDLVAIQNQEEIQHLNQSLPFHGRYYWIGIRKLGGTWTWVGTKKVLTKEAENWAAGEPNNRRSNQDCVEIYIKRQQESGKWNDEPCSRRKKALCYRASCQPFSCSQRGECLETIGSYRCECYPGFHGPECEDVVQCARLQPEGVHMNCSHPFGDFSYNSTCVFQCQEGFQQEGVSRLQCLASQQWSAETPTCTAITCPVLSAPDQGDLNCSQLHGDFAFGSTCAFSCQVGFELVGSETLECTATGTWSGDAPQCEAVKCSALAMPEMGHAACSHLHGDFAFGSTCAFSCQVGFELNGTETLECTATGTWSGDAPQCEAITCPVLSAPDQGDLNCSHLHGDFAFGSTCDFSCQVGFELKGTKSLECTATGTWNGDAPQCEAVKCSALAMPEMGHAACSHLHGDFAFGSTCAFSCQVGFELVGSETLECTATGTWSGDAPQCEAITCPVLSAPDQGDLNCSQLHRDFAFGSTCDFSCQVGFVLKGTESLECTATGTWSGDAPQCEAITCPVLSAPDQGDLNCSQLHRDFAFGSTCDFSCQVGFELKGTKSLECTATGTWTGSPPQCEAITCPVLSAPDQGDLNCSHLHGDFAFSSTCDFSCQVGFELVGSETRECTATGTWSGDAPHCRAISCPELDPPSRAELNCSHQHGNFTYNSLCTFSCEEGFVRMGAEVLRCAATGNWTRQPPVCAEDRAPFLKQVLASSSGTALALAGIVLSGTLIALLAKRLSTREEKKQLLNSTSDLGSPGIFTNAAYDANLSAWS
ncbi:P-selectin isoform X4 [Heliangelus exortis]|uniref:P-selectin isoform X4 n=1 Tax=Heliangelus exortis TaxID=472823 RepID=UPI003A8D777C